jgi:hypothetical protein
MRLLCYRPFVRQWFSFSLPTPPFCQTVARVSLDAPPKVGRATPCAPPSLASAAGRGLPALPVPHPVGRATKGRARTPCAPPSFSSAAGRGLPALPPVPHPVGRFSPVAPRKVGRATPCAPPSLASAAGRGLPALPGPDPVARVSLSAPPKVGRGTPCAPADPAISRSKRDGCRLCARAFGVGSRRWRAGKTGVLMSSRFKLPILRPLSSNFSF